MTKSFIRKFVIASIIIVIILLVGMIRSPKAVAAIQNPKPKVQVSFTFDDGGESDINIAAPILAQYGITGTSYVVTSCVGIVVVPNSCNADPGIKYMTWAQIQTLQNHYGWEVGSHSATHPLMSEISNSRIEKELVNSKNTLKNHGINATSFATPFGDYDQQALERIAKYYDNHRPFHDIGYNQWPYNDYMLRVQQVQVGVSVETVKGYIDKAAADNTWLILVFHDIENQPSSALKGYQYSSTDLAEIARYVSSQNMATTNISKGVVKAEDTDNLISNPSVGSNLGNGWTTDQPTNIKVDTASKGSMSEPKKSVKVTPKTNKTTHLFAPAVNVKSNSQYVIKGYVNLNKTRGGEIGFYIDEYDAAGNWISGQYKQTINSWYSKDLSFVYMASSSLVTKASLQIIIMGNKGTVVYFDNIRWYEVVSGSIPKPEPTPTSLLPNGDFEQGLSGWSVDSSAIMLDSANNGTSPTALHSVKLTNIQDKNAHLFSPKISITNPNIYKINADINALSINNGGEIGFYIDEYDAAGNWISGQYLYTVREIGNKKIVFNYTPTSVNVNSFSLQVIVLKGTGLIAYLDNVKVISL